MAACFTALAFPSCAPVRSHDSPSNYSWILFSKKPTPKTTSIYQNLEVSIGAGIEKSAHRTECWRNILFQVPQITVNMRWIAFDRIAAIIPSRAFAAGCNIQPEFPDNPRNRGLQVKLVPGLPASASVIHAGFCERRFLWIIRFISSLTAFPRLGFIEVNSTCGFEIPPSDGGPISPGDNNQGSHYK